jgi:hypothetical protein
MRETIDMAREAGWKDLRDYDSEMRNDFFMGNTDSLKAFEALVRADEREETNRRANASWTLMCEKMVASEREAIAKWLEDEKDAPYWAEIVRARGNT